MDVNTDYDALCQKDKSNKDGNEIHQDIASVGVALSANETVGRFGSANAEFIKGYQGFDNETGQKFAKGLKAIAQHKVNADPLEAEKNIKQQAGYSAEVAATSRDNATSIIQGSKVRTSRSDDLPEYGKNHNVVDRVQILNGEIIEGSQAQMKFVGNRNQLLERIAREDGKFARYRGVQLELPSEQFEGAKTYCQEKSIALREQAQRVRELGNSEIADKLCLEADNYDQLASNIKDSGLTTKDALFYRKHPELATALDIARTSHQAGMEGAKYGAVIGGGISVLRNAFMVAQGKLEVGDAMTSVATEAAKAGALGYATASTGSVIKSVMQQSGAQTIRTLADTSAPTLVVNICLSLGSSVKRYVDGEISEAQFLAEVGEKGAGMLSSGMMAALGQIAIPVPFIGAAIGGMVGYTLSSLFYQSALDAATAAEASRKNLTRVRAIQEAARARIAEEQAAFDAFLSSEMPQLRHETQQLFAMVESSDTNSGDRFAAAINRYASLLDKQLQFESLSEFEVFFNSDQPLHL